MYSHDGLARHRKPFAVLSHTIAVAALLSFARRRNGSLYRLLCKLHSATEEAVQRIDFDMFGNIPNLGA
jgi:hypothetical protein